MILNFTFSTDTRFSYSCACPSTFTDLDLSNPGRNCQAIAPCCEKIKLSREVKYASGASAGFIWLICEKIESTREKFEYQCNENGDTNNQVLQGLRKDVPSAIIYSDRFTSGNAWFAIEGQTYSQASSLQSFSFFSRNDLGEGIPEERCPELGLCLSSHQLATASSPAPP